MPPATENTERVGTIEEVDVNGVRIVLTFSYVQTVDTSLRVLQAMIRRVLAALLRMLVVSPLFLYVSDILVCPSNH